MDEEKVYKLVGLDPNGVRRVWAADYGALEAEAKCRIEAENYVKERPDTGPLSMWKFEWK